MGIIYIKSIPCDVFCIFIKGLTIKLGGSFMREKICGIYKIGFLTTSKVYIGQSTDIYRRITEHWASANATKDNLNSKTQRDYMLPVHRAMRKYGRENVYIEILERCSREQLNERGRYWIQQYQSNNKEYGYNLASGGQDTFGLKGERHSRAILSQEQVGAIKEELRNGNFTMRAIADQYNLSPVTITNINTGKTWFDKKDTYPLRPLEKNIAISKEAVKQKHLLASREDVISIREKYATMCSLQEIYDAFPQFKTGYINRLIYRSQSYPDIPLFNRKTQQWEYRNTK